MPRPTVKDQQMANILVLVVKRVGEILVTTPSIRALRKAYPKAEITVVVDESYHDVLAGNPHLNHIFLLDPRDSPLAFLKKAFALRNKKFDITIDYLANPRSAIISLLSGAPIRIGLNKRYRRVAYNQYIPSYPDVTPYIADHRINAIRALGKQSDGPEMDFFIDDEALARGRQILAQHGIGEGKPYITVSPVSLVTSKLWSFESYAKVVDYLLLVKKQKVVLVCGPGEIHFLEKVQSHMEDEPTALIEFHQLKVLGYVLQQGAFHVGNDGGIKHLASAVDTPTITIFGPGPGKEWNEYRDPRHVVLQKEISCRKYRCDRDCPHLYKCLDLVEFQDVKQAIDSFLS